MPDPDGGVAFVLTTYSYATAPEAAFQLNEADVAVTPDDKRFEGAGHVGKVVNGMLVHVE